MSTATLFGAIDAITRVRGVRGAMAVSAQDGLVVAESVMEGVRSNALAALTASLIQRARRTSVAASWQRPKFVDLKAERGSVLAVWGDTDLLVVAITDPGVNLGLVRLEMIKALEAIR